MANICSVTMYFYGEKSAVEDLHAKCQRWMNMGGKAAKLLSALNINKEGLDLRCEVCDVGELFIGPTGDRTFVLDVDCAWDATPAIGHLFLMYTVPGMRRLHSIFLTVLF